MEKEKLTAEKLTEILSDQIYGLQEGKVSKGVAKEISNTAGKIIAISKVQIDYARMWGGKIDIPFLSKEDIILD